MKDAAQDALSFVQGRCREDLDTDRLLAYGLVKAIEIAGEAANQVSKDTLLATVRASPSVNLFPVSDV